MGNCLVLEDKAIRVMKTDGKILEYQAPLRVDQVLSEFSNHAISDSLEVFQQHLLPETKLISGNLYYLVPLPLSPAETKKSKKKVRFSIPEVKDGEESSVVRIKVVINKQQLQDMLQKGVSVRDMLSHLQGQKKVSEIDTSNDNNSYNWKPALESIIEVN